LQPVGGAAQAGILSSSSWRITTNSMVPVNNPTRGEEIPLESRIITVARVYDAMTSDRPYRKAITTFEPRKLFSKARARNSTPGVVRAFSIASGTGQMEVPRIGWCSLFGSGGVSGVLEFETPLDAFFQPARPEQTTQPILELPSGRCRTR